MTISKTYLQKDSNSLNAAEQRFDVMPCGAGLSAPKTSLNKLCYNQMRDIAKNAPTTCRADKWNRRCALTAIMP